MTVLSALLVFGSIAAFATVYASASHRQAFLMVTRTIQQGDPISADELGSVHASISEDVHPVPVSDAPALSGRRAAVTIPSGSLLTMADTTTEQAIAPGNAVVGMALKAGQLPSSGVGPGDSVMIIETGAAGTPLASPVTSISSSDGSGTSGSSVLVPRASVFDVQTQGSTGSSTPNVVGGPSSSNVQLVSVEVPDGVAPAVSNAAAAGQVSVVLLPGSSGSRNPDTSQAGGGSGSAKAGGS